MQYYFLLTLQNGTVLDIPAGRTAFEPAVIHQEHPDRGSSTELRKVALNVQTFDAGMGIYQMDQVVPACVSWRKTLRAPDPLSTRAASPLSQLTPLHCK
jgi:hypothetical protein